MSRVIFLHPGNQDMSKFLAALRKKLRYPIIDISKTIDYLCKVEKDDHLFLISDELEDKGENATWIHGGFGYNKVRIVWVQRNPHIPEEVEWDNVTWFQCVQPLNACILCFRGPRFPKIPGDSRSMERAYYCTFKKPRSLQTSSAAS